MTVRNKILLSVVLTSFAFWIPIWLPLSSLKGIAHGTAYEIIAIYLIAVVLLEYPTGVIGDAFSHKISTQLGYLAICVASIWMAFASGALQLTLGVLTLALGTSLISGSDQAYFYGITGDEYRGFYPTMKNIGLIATLVGISSGTILYNINPLLPLILNALAFAGAFFVMSTLPEEQPTMNEAQKKAANPFAVAKLGLKTFLTSKNLQSALIIYAIVFAFSNNLKWLYANLLSLVNLPVQYWGILITIFYLGRFIGTQLQRKLKGKKASIILLVALANLIFLLGYIYNPILIPLVIFLVMIIIGAVETDLEIDIQENAPTEVRSSILSLKSLLGRLSAAVYIALAGLLTSPTSLTKLTMASFALILFAIGVQISAYIKKKENISNISAQG